MPETVHCSRHVSRGSAGFIILYTVLISTVILTVIIGIVGISYKELLLAGSARESHVSFFSADTGIECGMYLDRKQSAFLLPTPTGDCAGQPIEIETIAPPLYTFKVNTDANSCSKVRVNKDFDPTPDDGIVDSYTQVTAWGYNASCDALALGASGIRLVERKIEATYANIFVAPPEGGIAVPLAEGDPLPDGAVVPVE